MSRGWYNSGAINEVDSFGEGDILPDLDKEKSKIWFIDMEINHILWSLQEQAPRYKLYHF